MLSSLQVDAMRGFWWQDRTKSKIQSCKSLGSVERIYACSSVAHADDTCTAVKKYTGDVMKVHAKKEDVMMTNAILWY